MNFARGDYSNRHYSTATLLRLRATLLLRHARRRPERGRLEAGLPEEEKPAGSVGKLRRGGLWEACPRSLTAPSMSSSNIYAVSTLLSVPRRRRRRRSHPSHLSQHRTLQPTAQPSQGSSQQQSQARLNECFETIRQEFDGLSQEFNLLRGQRDDFESKGAIRSLTHIPHTPTLTPALPPFLRTAPAHPPQSPARSTSSTSSARASTTSRHSMVKYANNTKKSSAASAQSSCPAPQHPIPTSAPAHPASPLPSPHPAPLSPSPPDPANTTTPSFPAIATAPTGIVNARGSTASSATAIVRGSAIPATPRE